VADKYGERRSINMKKVIDFLKNEEGAALAEYGLLTVLIAVACVTAITAVGGSVNGLFEDGVSKWP
jgi:pilus assembly protein Flp/PilA